MPYNTSQFAILTYALSNVSYAEMMDMDGGMCPMCAGMGWMGFLVFALVSILIILACVLLAKKIFKK